MSFIGHLIVCEIFLNDIVMPNCNYYGNGCSSDIREDNSPNIFHLPHKTIHDNQKRNKKNPLTKKRNQRYGFGMSNCLKKTGSNIINA